MDTKPIPHPETTPHLTVPEAAEIYGISLPTAYDRCNDWLRTAGTEGIPCLKLGRKTLVLTAGVRRQFGLDHLEAVPAA